VVALAIGCGLKHEPVRPAGAVKAPCQDLVDLAGRPVVVRDARWHAPSDPAEQRRLAVWCSTVGPGVFHAPRRASADPTSDLVVVSWNVHVGGGELAALVRELRSGRFSDGVPPGGFVLLLQEAFRGGPRVPQAVPAGAPVPDRIEAASPAGVRDDVTEVAVREDLALLYLPSMRNGRESHDRSEDRGNAILSTFELTEPTGVELPLGRHRRVAVAAAVGGRDSRARPWRLRVVSAHLDASTGPRHLWLFTSAQRERQARHLVDVLDDDATHTVVGADLNTWAGGTREPAFREFQREFPRATIGSRFAHWLTLDYVFFRLLPDWQSESRPIDSAFGSDHRPVVSHLRLE
jgi:endonuclease/exonuclease/phosphatase family metal-dependent hydrolase